MWLIDARTERLAYFISHSPPPYAILSHRWKDEIVFQDFVRGQLSEDGIKKEASYRKLQKTCRQALRDNCNYCWIDNCCIDKSSSAELQESINSMYAWYAKARVCYVFLEDVLKTHADENIFKTAAWTTRGWTLQEVLAPTNVKFYNESWTFLGSKTSLSHPLSRATRIPEKLLTGHDSLGSYSIAQRMSWAANRNTTVPEDVAYCLLGLFEVHMPLLYGEGQANAFLRLQEEILKRSTDQTLFAWRDLSGNHSAHGILADHPTQFYHSTEVTQLALRPDSYSLTNLGIKIKPTMYQIPKVDKEEDDMWVMLLQCTFASDCSYKPETGKSGAIGILLQKSIYARYTPNLFIRSHVGRLVYVDKSFLALGEARKIFVGAHGAYRARLPTIEYQCLRNDIYHMREHVSGSWSTTNVLESSIRQQRQQRQHDLRYVLISRVGDPKRWAPIGWTDILKLDSDLGSVRIAEQDATGHHREFTIWLGLRRNILGHSCPRVFYMVDETWSEAARPRHSLFAKEAIIANGEIPGPFDFPFSVTCDFNEQVTTDTKFFFFFRFGAREGLNSPGIQLVHGL